ncbi:hypothetical protein [Pseudomonas sp. StFLB209]|uniref:hypothetical protein n=1 Tax=Pseudomonas sp. StFLB209 TaxID=1028989 RepID=UPI0011854938|nr:hypothetical protein [Pseudomonas sp. StFLB209]
MSTTQVRWEWPAGAPVADESAEKFAVRFFAAVVWTAGFAPTGDPILKAAKWGKTACSWFGSALRADFPLSGADSGAGAMGVLPSAPETDIHVGFSPKSTPTLGQHPSRDSRHLCHLRSKSKSNINGTSTSPEVVAAA